MEKLSSVLSEAILQALEDLETIMNDPNYVIDFDVWHEPIEIHGQFTNYNNITKCSVCFAGSVMANRLGAEFDSVKFTFDFEEEKMLDALDFIRRGDIREALTTLDLSPKGFRNKNNINQHDYHIFKKQMLEIVDVLKAKGF